MKKIFIAILLLILLQPTVFAEETDHLEQGKAHFKNAFYRLTPKHRQAEAAQEYSQAIHEFKKVITAHPNNKDAYRYLGRVYSMQDRPAKAAEAYLKVIELDPQEVDTYVLAAVELIGSQQYDKAIQTLQAAKEHTGNKSVLQKIDVYINRIEVYRNEKEVSDVK